MTATEIILQCEKCRRYFNAPCGGPPSLRPERFLACVPEIFRCLELDCDAVAARLAAYDERRRQHRIDRRIARENPSSADRGASSNFRSSCPPEADDRPVTFGPDARPTPSQQEFQASGKAASADDKLIEFFEHQLKTDGLGKWFSRVLLKQICGNDYINNRVVDARAHFEPCGFTIQNADVSPDGVKPMTSHYRIVRKF